jgi:hypothetical protein
MDTSVLSSSQSTAHRDLYTQALRYEVVYNENVYDDSHTLSLDEVSVEGAEQFLREHGTEFASKLYFAKSRDWESEQEYRFLWIDHNAPSYNEAEYIAIHDCITAVCLGANFPPELIPHIKAAVEPLHLRIWRIRYIQGKLSIWDAVKEAEDFGWDF